MAEQRTVVYDSFQDAPLPPEPSVVAIGFFDGVHRGHQSLLQTMTATAEQQQMLPVIVTFQQHPATILRPGTAPAAITTAEERRTLLSSVGAARLYMVPFTRELSEHTAHQFCDDILVRRLGAKALVMGPDFALGKGREGNVARLRELGADLGFDVRCVERLATADGVVSSTAIRALLEDGDVATAARQIGRPFILTGNSVSDRGVGTQIGVPTINLVIDAGKIVPCRGVYAGIVPVDGREYACVLNIGLRPTFGDGPLAVEFHVLDFRGTTEQTHFTVQLRARLRDEQRFSGPAELVAQIQHDIAQAKALLSR